VFVVTSSDLRRVVVKVYEKGGNAPSRSGFKGRFPWRGAALAHAGKALTGVPL